MRAPLTPSRPPRPAHPMRAAALALSCAVGLALPARGQEQEAAPPRQGAALDDAQREMLELFRSVEQRLREIDELLSDAGAGDTRRLAGAGEAAVSRLIESSIESGRQNLRDIDRIIELAQQFGQQSSSSGEPGSPEGQEDSGESPLDRGPQTQQRESTPEGPAGMEPEGEEPEAAGEEPQGEGDEQAGEQGQPRDPGAAGERDPTNREGDDPPADPTATPPRGPDTTERWGDLPVKVRDVFRHEGSEDLPPQYREWIDAYYRRLQRQERR